MVPDSRSDPVIAKPDIKHFGAKSSRGSVGHEPTGTARIGIASRFDWQAPVRFISGCPLS